MGLKEFTAKDILTMDNGKLAIAMDQAIRRCVEDCIDRPGTSAARKVTLVMSLEPDADEEGDLYQVHASFTIDEATPKRRSKAYGMDAGKNGLFFNDLSADNARQSTINLTGPRRAVGGDDE